MPNHPAVERFRAEYPGIEPLVMARAPGRVNLIGEHIDYNDGIVLPIAIDLETRVVIGRTSDGRVRVRSASRPGELNYETADIPMTPGGEWDAYVRGVMVMLAERGIQIPACAIWIESNIPPGAGLSSSAALEVGVTLAILAASGRTLPMRAVADLCREAEHRFAGVPCGIMDQYACALAKQGHALAIDCRDKSVRHVPWPESNPAVLIMDTGIERRLAAGGYAKRVQECKEALSQFIKLGGVQGWRDVMPGHLYSSVREIVDLQTRRARHIVSENIRTRHAIAALEQNACPRIGELMRESHASLSDDYEVSLPEIDQIVEGLCKMPGVFGAKLTGAGFGGCVVALVDRSKRADLEAALSSFSPGAPVGSWKSYFVNAENGATCAIISSRTSAGE